MAKVSIIIPTYNREHMLQTALDSIRDQTFTDWELIVVDDGSTDNTQALVAAFQSSVPQQVHYIRQTNGGVGSARNTGLGHARADFIAWLDSDDHWLPDHLTHCVAALEAHPSVQWIFAAFRRVDITTGNVLAASSFYQNDGKPLPMLDLHTKQEGDVHLIEDDRSLIYALQNKLFAYLGASVFRRAFFEQIRFPIVAVHEDTILITKAVTFKMQIAYMNQVCCTVRDHDDHTCSRNLVNNPEKHIRIKMQEVAALETLSDISDRWPADAQHEWHARVANEAFWSLGYTLLWQKGHASEAIKWFRLGRSHMPNNVRMKRFLRKARVAKWLGLAPKIVQSKPNPATNPEVGTA